MYFIYKSTRLPDCPYSGPSCDKAGVPKGKLYDYCDSAEADAKKLSDYNPVGFKVQCVEDLFVDKDDVDNWYTNYYDRKYEIY